MTARHQEGIITILLFLLLLFILLLAYIGMCKAHGIHCVQYGKIVEIGGCDRNGLCGIKFEDGTTGHDNYPIIGTTICRKRETTWTWVGFE